MKAVQCEKCTGNEFDDLPNGKIKCRYCGTVYDHENDTLTIASSNGGVAVSGNGNLVITGGSGAAVRGNSNVVVSGDRVGVVGNGMRIKGGIHFD